MSCAVSITRIQSATFKKTVALTVEIRRSTSRRLLKNAGDIDIIRWGIVFRDVSERTKDLFSDPERALIDQPPEFFFRYRQFVDVAVAGAADHKNISLTLFWLRFFWLLT